MNRITAHRLQLFDWSSGELRPIGGSTPLATWQMKKEARTTWILVRAHEWIQEFDGYPVAYRITKRGEEITRGWFDWTVKERPLLRPDKSLSLAIS